MTAAIDLWISTAYKPAFRSGGWAFIRPDPGGLFAMAGGARRVTGEEVLIGGLLGGLTDLAHRPAASLETVCLRVAPTERKSFASLLARLAGKGDPQEPTLDPGFRRAVLEGLNRRGLRLGPPAEADDPALGFLIGWADLAREKATASGAFSASIPRANLAKIAGYVTA